MSLLWVVAAGASANEHVWKQPGAMHWDEVQEKHPTYDVRPESHPHPDYPEEYDGPNEDQGWAVDELAHKDSGDGEHHSMGGEYDIPYTNEKVPLDKIRYMPDPTNPRTTRAAIGYHHGEDVPPPLLVHRAGEYHVADGHHRCNGAQIAGKREIDAIVGHSPRTDRLEY